MHTVKAALLLEVDADGAARKAAGKLLISILGEMWIKNKQSRSRADM